MILVIVESPTKAKKIQTYLGSKYVVLSSQGHIVELDTKRLNSMISSGFQPIYKLQSSKKRVIQQLKSVKHSHVILAADDDREGDAIAWHCGNLLKVDFNQSNRIVFNEISKRSIQKAFQNPTQINLHSVNSQRCRQLLDLIIGFKLSPLLWKHIDTPVRGLSAGRVQSCLLRMIQEHETKITTFQPQSTYVVQGVFSINETEFPCLYVSKETEFSDSTIDKLFQTFHQNRVFTIKDRKQKRVLTYPPNPLITSSLQQIAQKECGFSVQQTMQIAQKLYENGKITYMRTDSTNLSKDFVVTLKRHIDTTYGNEYYQTSKNKVVKGAQEAHEAIRPTNIEHVLSDGYQPCDKRLYDLIRKITIQSHMKPANYDQYTYTLQNDKVSGIFQGSHKFLQFAGYLNYKDTREIETSTPFEVSDKGHLQTAEGYSKQTKPPSYWNESAIVKQLESSGVGRPSTYASILNTLYSRSYTEMVDIPEVKREVPQKKLSIDGTIQQTTRIETLSKQTKRVKMTNLGQVVLEYLLTHFPTMIHVEFTSRVESDLDKVSQGTLDWVRVIQKIYDTFMPIVKSQMNFKHKKRDSSSIHGYQLKQGPYGDYIHDPETNQNYKLSYYLTYHKKKTNQLTEEDIQKVVSYPISIGMYKKTPIEVKLNSRGHYFQYKSRYFNVSSDHPDIQECIQLIESDQK